MHAVFVPLVGFRLGEREMLELGMSLPGLAARAGAIGRLPALGVLTLAGMLPPHWTCSYLETEDAERIAAERPGLVAVSCLTASAPEAYRLGDGLRARGIRCVLGGLHATACPDDAAPHFDSVVVGEGEPVWPDVLRD
ncbi:MAG: cobalamin-dependent protein, partial [Gemmataceae bacterium]|nr:cobalamin-dependent protein [Gemmataceae bacterium]